MQTAILSAKYNQNNMNLLLLHGIGDGPDMWLPWLKTELEKLGHTVSMPTLPDSDNPDLSKQLPFLESGLVTPDTIVVGHSSACPLILSLAERSHIKRAIFVAGYFSMPGKTEAIWQEDYDFAAIKSNCSDFLFVVSDDDPWGCNDQLSRPYFDQLGGTFVVVKGGGHFGSNHFKKPLYELPLLLKLLV